MWTPRRLLLFLAGLGLCVGAFAAYSLAFGRIDGLPPLPAEYFVRRSPDDNDPLPAMSPAVIDVKLQRAFGPACLELNYNHRLELQKNGIILATNELRIEPDGRCKLRPFSVAVIKDRGAGQEAEIYTVHADEAYLLFDEPVKNLSDMGKRKIVGCDLVSDPMLLSPDPRRHRITCNHNRSTADADDDLALETTGPVVYRDADGDKANPGQSPSSIETTAAVRLTDKRGQPQATTITAMGMKIHLASEPPKPGAKGKHKAGAVTGVRRVILTEQVAMNLWIDPKGGFLTSGRPGAEGESPASRSNVQITTPGPFTYDVGAEFDKARFDMKPAPPGGQPGFVQVVRPLVRDNATYYDRLDCDALELQFDHKPNDNAGPNQSVRRSESASLQWVHAWGQYLVLTSQSDNMQAHGNDLLYTATTKQTILSGKPEVTAIKDGHEIHAPQLHLTPAESGGGQEAVAVGAGYFMGRFNGGNPNANAEGVTARWRERMHYQKLDGQELITLTGSARFEDPGRKQSIAGDRIKLTLASEAGSGQPAPGGQPRMKPRRLEVTGRVVARSPELFIHDTETLVVLFKEAPATARPASPSATPSPAPGVVPIPNDKPEAAVKPDEPAVPAKNPLDLASRSVQAFLITPAQGPTILDTVHCEGAVKVHQEPAKPNEKAVDMSADTLDLTRRPEGHLLELSGDISRPAEVHLPDLSLLGLSIRLDQFDNEAFVKGEGSMKIVSTTDLQGNKLEKPSDLLIAWKTEMRFDGKIANFVGNVQADQENSRLLCHSMQATLDKAMKFSQDPNNSGGARSANIERVVCDTEPADGSAPASVVDSLREHGRLVRYQRIEARELSVYKSDGRLDAAGPGEVRILQMGPKETISAAPQNGPRLPKPPGPPEEELKLTFVRYNKKLIANNQPRIARFWENVEVLHLPADNPRLQDNFNRLIDKLPAGALYLKCDQLDILTQPQAGSAKTTHIMVANGKAVVQFDEYYGSANVIKYNEAQQQIIFEGLPGQPAVVNVMKGVGAKPRTLRGEKFIYNRLTGRFDGNGVTWIEN